MGGLGVQPADVDLVVDLPSGDAPAVQALVASNLLRALPFQDDWRTLTASFSAFPAELSAVVALHSEQLLPRADAEAWTRLVTRVGQGRVPTFGDYGADSPNFLDVDPRFLKMVANIRYTTQAAWLVLRGGLLTGAGAPGFGQFHDLAARLRDRDEYRGPEFSRGDHIIYECAARRMGPGNATTWREVATSHHLTHVVDSLATTGAP